MSEIEKKLEDRIAETIQSSRAQIIEDLEALKNSDDEHAEFYESLQIRQNEIIQDLEAMLNVKD